MDLKGLEDLLALLEEQSFTRAAKRRHVTQPAFSRRIRLLEDWLGVDIVDRRTKPVSILPAGRELEEGFRDLITRLYALRSRIQAKSKNQDRISFVAQHTLAMSRFPRLIKAIKRQLPDTAYRVTPVNNHECESQFRKEGQFLLCYEASHFEFDFTYSSVKRIFLNKESLIPVISRDALHQFNNIQSLLTGNIPMLMYQEGGFMADVIARTCLPQVMRDYKIDVICESAFSASLKEMALADMGVAWLAEGIIEKELSTGTLISLDSYFGSTELDIVLYYREDNQSEQAKRVFEYLHSEF
jgi:DNA-binding transcriptional LysR family regulator|tara:strand:+ start:140 stop:1036 length:897 start_codon:yes stop_codon:yes gene_type:complete